MSIPASEHSPRIGEEKASRKQRKPNHGRKAQSITTNPLLLASNE